MPYSVQYASTSDAVSIAHWAIGSGVPLVIPPVLSTSHLEMEWQIALRGFDDPAHLYSLRWEQQASLA